MRLLVLLSFFATAAIFSGNAVAQPEQTGSDTTCFQTAAPFEPALHIGSDVAIVYGVNQSLPQRIEGWREHGYTIHLMTGIAWGGYQPYFRGEFDGVAHEDEIQTRSNGSKMSHGGDVYYNVPTESYASYLEPLIKQAIDNGVEAIHLEEPEFWVEAGWSDSFKREWLSFYREPWQPPDSSVDARYRCAKLKYHLYYRCLGTLFSYAKEYARSLGRDVSCYVPTHSMINYAHWGIVSPESHLIDIPELDGYIAQVWTGTARTPNIYRGVRKERTFETALMEYGQMMSMVRPTGKKVWFLADPIEDNPDRSWADYKKNYECTIVASLMYPEVSHYEVMPWPRRIFRGKYPKVDIGDGRAVKDTPRGGIPQDYATQILAVINALNDMKQPAVNVQEETRGIGVLVSDTMMFQRGAPKPSDHAMSSFYGIALPLLKHGIHLEPVQMENLTHKECLRPYSVLLLTYENQLPLKPEYHEKLTRWVEEGNSLVFFDGSRQPYASVREWWNTPPHSFASPQQHLFGLLGLDEEPVPKQYRCGKGTVFISDQSPQQCARSAKGAQHVISVARKAFMTANRNAKFIEKNSFVIQRGPYVVSAALDESVCETPVILRGRYIDVFDPKLSVLREKRLLPGERSLIYDISYARENRGHLHVAVSGSRIRDERAAGRVLRFTSVGPLNTRARTRIIAPSKPASLEAMDDNGNNVPCRYEWDEDSGTVLVTHENRAQPISFTLKL